MEENKSKTESPPGATPAEKPKVAPKPAAKPAPKAVPKAAAKPKVEKKPLIDNGNGTITDPNSGLMWKQSDAWLDMHKFFTWDNHTEYIEKFNKEKFAGFEDWRIPSKAEAMTLFDKTLENLDKNGTKFPLDPIFSAGGASTTWISECTPEKVVRFDYKIGNDFAYPPTEIWSSMRLVRKTEVPDQKEKSETEEKKAEASKPANPEVKPA